MNLMKFLKAAFFIKHLLWLLLDKGERVRILKVFRIKEISNYIAFILPNKLIGTIKVWKLCFAKNFLLVKTEEIPAFC